MIPLKRFLAIIAILLFSMPVFAQIYASQPRFKALVYYSDTVEPAHVEFAKQAIDYFEHLSWGEGFILDKTRSLAEYPYEKLKEYSMIIALNASPWDQGERATFEKYMENGGGWLGFHAAAYNDANTKWPWYVKFLGGGVFYCNNWPPQPALLEVDTNESPVTRSLPPQFVAAESEWYQWKPSPRLNPDVEVLVSLSPKNYPFGIKDIVTGGDFPVVWRNKNYRMIYLNFGHGDREFLDPTQNLLVVNSFRFVASLDPTGNPFEK